MPQPMAGLAAPAEELALAEVLPVLQDLMDRLHRLVGVAMAIVDLKGRVQVASGWQDICTRFHRVAPTSRLHCVQSDTELARGVRPGEYSFYRCRNNLYDFATPIVVSGRHVANLFFGQFLLDSEPPDLAVFERQAAEHGFDRSAYLAALARVPRLDRKRVEEVMGTFVGLADLVVRLSQGASALRERSREDEEALRRSERSLREAQRIAHLGNWELDLVHDVLHWSDEIYRIFEIDPDAFGASYQAFIAGIHPDDRDRVNQAYADSVKNRRPYTIEHRLRMPDGRVKWVSERCETTYDTEGRPLRSVGTVLDVTERRAAEEALLRERDRAVSILEASPVAMLRVERDGRLAVANQAAGRLLGLEQLGTTRLPLNLSKWQVADADGHPVTAEQLPFAKLLRTRAPVHGEFAVVRPDGQRLHLTVRATPLLGASGDLEGAVFGVEDVGDARRLERQLRQSQKLEAVGQLASGVAHDFNNLLTVILGGCEALLETTAGSSGPQAEVMEIREAGRRAAALTRQLLTFSRHGVAQPRVLAPGSIVLGMDRMLRRLITEEIELVAHTGASTGRVRIDPGQLEQVIVNLVVNARDAMAAGGRLTLELADVELGEPEVRRHVEVRPGRYVMLAVGDTGSGMSEEVQAHLFEPFFTTKSSGRGTGLGLSVVYGIVKQAGGHVLVYSEPGHGSTFKIYLPRVDAPETPEHVEPAGPPPRGHEAVLVVEDDDAVRRRAVATLRGLGYAVIEAADGVEGLRLAEAAAVPIELLVTDLIMPRLGGTELASRLRQLRPALKVLVTSGYTEHGPPHAQLGPGTAFLQKPFVPDALARAVRRLLDEPPAPPVPGPLDAPSSTSRTRRVRPAQRTACR